jgi:hypothetical protein
MRDRKRKEEATRKSDYKTKRNTWIKIKEE